MEDNTVNYNCNSTNFIILCGFLYYLFTHIDFKLFTYLLPVLYKTLNNLHLVDKTLLYHPSNECPLLNGYSFEKSKGWVAEWESARSTDDEGSNPDKA